MCLYESIRCKHNLSQMYLDLKGNESKSIQGFQAITYSSIEIRRLDEFNVQKNETGRGTYRKQMRNNGMYVPNHYDANMNFR